ncbi:MFS transporter [Zavarzinella formosa]|uniref:MFS transporter n=1 Tax=Zavarzinella formosa TaxID=360055 RepID=UPI0002EA1BDA|nr:MFS transporter [Zavarzinella formosa]
MSIAPGLAPQQSPRTIISLPFYYGWVVLVMASFAMTATLPGRTHGLGLITKPILDDSAFNITEVGFTTINMWAVIVGGAFCIPIGRLIDRFGVRVALVGVSAALGLSVLLMAGSISLVMLVVSLTLVRGFGQGALSVVSMAMVGKWFTRRIGLAMAVFTVLLSIGFIASTLGVGGAVEKFGWRPVWNGVGLVLLLGLAPLGWLLVRRTPESVGLPPDAPEEAIIAEPSLDLPLSAALCSVAFWTFTLSASLYNLIWSAITLLSKPMMAERGLDDETYLTVMSMMVAGGLPANLVCGWLARRVSLGLLLFVGMTALAGSLVAFPHVANNMHAVLYGLGLGVAGGIVTVVFFSINAAAFGRLHLGAIQGTAQVVSVIASAIGPVIAAVVRDQTGSSAAMFYACAPLAVLLGLVAWVAPLPKRGLEEISK